MLTLSGVQRLWSETIEDVSNLTYGRITLESLQERVSTHTVVITSMDFKWLSTHFLLVFELSSMMRLEVEFVDAKEQSRRGKGGIRSGDHWVYEDVATGELISFDHPFADIGFPKS